MQSKLGRDESVALEQRPLAGRDLIEKPLVRQDSGSQKRGKSRPQHNSRPFGQAREGWW